MKLFKPLLVVCAVLFALSFEAKAQKFIYVDTDYILENIPEYQQAQKELDELSVKWQNQIEAKYTEIDKLYKEFLAEQAILTEDMKRKKEDEIIKKEKEVKDYQKDKFGVEGQLFKRRQELIKPLQDDIYNAVKEIATIGNYAIVFDKSTQSNILFANSRYDKSDEVLKKLGIESEKE